MALYRDKSIIFYVERYAMRSVYISIEEHEDLMDNVTLMESKLYCTVKKMVMESPSATALKNAALAKRMGTSVNNVTKLKSSLKQKGYLVIEFTKDCRGGLLAQVFLGKKQVALYNLGLYVEITDSALQRELLQKFPVDNPTLSAEQRQKMVEEANEYARSLSSRK